MQTPNPPEPACPVQARIVTLTYSASLGGFDERPLRALLADQQLLDLRERYFEVHGLPHLLCLCLLRGAESPKEPAKRSRDSQPELTGSALALYQTLRAWRAERSSRDGLPPYVLFNNRELAALAEQRPASRQALLGIRGVGEGKVEKYGAELLELLAGGETQETPCPAP